MYSDKALVWLWQQLGAPDRLIVDEAVFRIAAQRLTLHHLGLQVEEERLKFVGYCGLPMENTEVQLGFAIFLLDLRTGSNGGDEKDEAIQRTGSSLELVNCNALNGRYNELNRLLKVQLPKIIELVRTYR